MILVNNRKVLYFILLISILFVAKYSGILNWYKTTTDTMQPTVAPKLIVFTTNLMGYEINNIVSFTNDHISEPFQYYAYMVEGDSLLHEFDHSHFLSRIVAKGGDTKCKIESSVLSTALLAIYSPMPAIKKYV